MTTPSAQSFLLSLQAQPNQRAAAPMRAFERTLVDRMRLLKAPTAAIFFVSGAASAGPTLAETVATRASGLRALVVPSPGVLTESGEVEGAPAVAALIWSGSKVALETADALGTHKGRRLVFTTRPLLVTEHLKLGNGTSLGAGSTGDAIYAVENGLVTTAPIAALVVSGGGAPVVEEAPGCRVVAGPFKISEVDRHTIVSLDDTPALDLLSKTMGGGKHGGMVVVAISSASSKHPLFRPIKGIDPGRKAIVVDASLSRGDTLSFAIRDAAFAKAELAEAARRAEQAALGSAPRFAMFLSCAGRGRSLYREPDVDVKILKKRFPKLPIAGMHASFEIVGDGGDEVALQQMSGLIALFRAPS